MKKYEFFSHTADTKFRSYGKNIEEAFTNAATALFSIITEPKRIKPAQKREIFAKGHDLKSLLFSYLEELLFLLDTEFLLLHHVEHLSIHKREDESYYLEAYFVGDKYSEDYETHGDVKAITYNEMEIIEEEGKVTLQVVPDI